MEQNLEFARDLQKNITQIYSEVSENRDLNLKSCYKSISVSKIHHLIFRAVVEFPLLIFLICPQGSRRIWNVYDSSCLVVSKIWDCQEKVKSCLGFLRHMNTRLKEKILVSK